MKDIEKNRAINLLVPRLIKRKTYKKKLKQDYYLIKYFLNLKIKQQINLII